MHQAVSINFLNCGLWALLATMWQLAPSKQVRRTRILPYPSILEEPNNYILRSDLEPLLAKTLGRMELSAPNA